MGEDLEKKLINLLNHEKSLTQVCEALGVEEFEALGMVKKIRKKGTNIVINVKDDDIYMLNQGDIKFHESNTYDFKTDKNHEFKFALISDTRFGSKYQQLSILNDIYENAHAMGIPNVILCGNITTGLYDITDPYGETCFLDDTQRQIDYINENYPKVKGIKTYLITGKLDDKHLKINKVNIGKRIQELRDDMVYLGDNSCDVMIDKVKMQILNAKLNKTYTVSYRPQQQIDSYRSEDKPDILLYGGLLQMEKFSYRNVCCISVPSLCATTKEMNDKRYSNTVGVWYVTVKTDDKGYLQKVTATNAPYYVTNKDDYKSAKVLRIGDK